MIYQQIFCECFNNLLISGMKSPVYVGCSMSELLMLALVCSLISCQTQLLSSQQAQNLLQNIRRNFGGNQVDTQDTPIQNIFKNSQGTTRNFINFQQNTAQGAQSVQPKQPTQPVQPKQPTQPVQPVQPTQPVQPSFIIPNPSGNGSPFFNGSPSNPFAGQPQNPFFPTNPVGPQFPFPFPFPPTEPTPPTPTPPSPPDQPNPLDFLNQLENIFPSINGYKYWQNFPPNLEQILNFPSQVRTIDGSNNNPQYPTYGKEHTALSRASYPNYKDGLSIPQDNLPNPRDISNVIGDLNGYVENNRQGVSMGFTIWGQFLDHDLDLTEAAKTESMPIPLKMTDPFYTQNNQFIPFTRSKFINSFFQQPRKHPNQVTTWLDGSQIYGSTQSTANQLRTFSKGKLKTSGQGLFLPLQQGFFLAGDIRVNENVFLTIYHTIFVRQHNRYCDYLLYSQPFLSDQKIYQSARHYVIGLLQKITYDEFLPKLLGRPAFQRLVGNNRKYDINIDPSIFIQFSTAAFRIGHSLLVSSYSTMNYNQNVIEQFNLQNLFFNPSLLTKKRFPQLLFGLVNTYAKERSQKMIDDVRNFLILGPNNNNAFLDLYSLNIQRGRDHGLPPYNDVRESFGLQRYGSFEEFLGYDYQRVSKFKSIYSSIDQMDLWVGIISEPKIKGAILGQLGSAIVGETFRKIKEGDRFWYENAYPNKIVNQIKSLSFSDIVRRTVPELFFIRKDIFSIN